MKKGISLFCLLLLCLSIQSNIYAEPKPEEEKGLVYSFFLSTGMSDQEINSMDEDILFFIYEDLQNANINEDLHFCRSAETMTGIGNMANPLEPMAVQLLSGITFYASAFKSGNTIYIYPTYEFTTTKRPRGMDCFTIELANAFNPFSYGGKLWVRNNSSEVWTSESYYTLTPTQVSLNGAKYEGTQLGTPDYAILIKGCTTVHATVGSGTDKRIAMNYMYNPNRANYSISFSAGGFGISVSSSGTVYSSGSIVTLSY